MNAVPHSVWNLILGHIAIHGKDRFAIWLPVAKELVPR